MLMSARRSRRQQRAPHREAVAVGGGQGQAVAFELGQHAGERRPAGVLGVGRRKDHLVDDLAQRGRRQPQRVLAVGRRDQRKLAGIDALDVRLEAGALQVQLIVRTTISMSILSGGIELTQSVSSRAGSVIAPSSSTCAPSQQLTPTSRLVAASFRRSVVGAQQDVAQHGQRAARGDGPPDDGQTLGEVFLQDRKAHGATSGGKVDKATSDR